MEKYKYKYSKKDCDLLCGKGTACYDTIKGDGVHKSQSSQEALSEELASLRRQLAECVKSRTRTVVCIPSSEGRLECGIMNYVEYDRIESQGV